MTNKLLFVGRFLAAFALLIIIGWATTGPTRYATLLRATAAVTSPVLTGWWLETRSAATGQELWFRRAGDKVPFLISLESLALGLLPLLALLGATPGIGIRRLAVNASIGCTALFALDLLVVVLYPLLVRNPNALTDITGTFLGLLTFVGGPVIIWFVLTFDQLRGVWRLNGAAVERRASRVKR